ncbi:SUN domain-containing protein 4 [Silene latifolia]|uniref:SUN domain-containing protein 4 n=1 Tax=Silene latifolia TaxID=37657 RepID=UPI003D77FDA2
MQKSRRALLQRRALGKVIGRDHLFKFSLSLVIVLWGLVFLLNLWISHGDIDTDTEESRPITAHNTSSWDEGRPEKNPLLDSLETNSFPSLDNQHLSETCANVDEVTGEVQSENTTKDKTVIGGSGSEESSAVGSTNSVVEHRKESKDNGKADRQTRTVPLGLDEFKSKALNSKSAYVSGGTGGVIHRMEPGGGKYNYASSAKGAKVLDSNKEAKGASNILNKDKDKYLRNPCSAEEKFVVIELSEETLVDTIEVANFEHYSSNLKEFELLGSLAYPTQKWVELGNFSAGNVKHAQTFTLSEPKWVRYLKLKILSHHGSEFYCTLSSIEVYGVDAVERMLEDLISDPDNHHAATEKESTPHVPESSEQNSPDKNASNGNNLEASPKSKTESVTDTALDPVEETRPQPVSRMPGDTVLKILMQKVRALDLSLSVLERYLENVNAKYGSIFKEFDQELEEKDVVLEKIKLDMKNVVDSKDLIAKDVDDLMAWKSLVAEQINDLIKDNAILRSDVRKVRENQMYMESKGIVVFVISLFFGFLGIVMLFRDVIVNSVNKSQKSGKFWWVRSSWSFLFLSCSITVLILSL